MAAKPWVKEAIDAIQDPYIKGLVKTLDKYLIDDAVVNLAKYICKLEKKAGACAPDSSLPEPK